MCAGVVDGAVDGAAADEAVECAGAVAHDCVARAGRNGCVAQSTGVSGGAGEEAVRIDAYEPQAPSVRDEEGHADWHGDTVQHSRKT